MLNGKTRTADLALTGMPAREGRFRKVLLFPFSEFMLSFSRIKPPSGTNGGCDVKCPYPKDWKGVSAFVTLYEELFQRKIHTDRWPDFGDALHSSAPVVW